MYELTDINCMTEYQLNKEFKANIQEAEEWTNRGYWECDRILWETQCEYGKFASIQHEGIVGDFFKFVWWIIKKAIQLIVKIFKLIFKMVGYVIKAIKFIFGDNSSSGFTSNTVQKASAIKISNNMASIQTIKVSGNNRKKKIANFYSQHIKNFSKVSNSRVKSETQALNNLKRELKRVKTTQEAYQFFKSVLQEKGRIKSFNYQSLSPNLDKDVSTFDMDKWERYYAKDGYELAKKNYRDFIDIRSNADNIPKELLPIGSLDKNEYIARLKNNIDIDEKSAGHIYEDIKRERDRIDKYKSKIPTSKDIDSLVTTKISFYGQDFQDSIDKTNIFTFDEKKNIALLESENIVEEYNNLVKRGVAGLIDTYNKLNSNPDFKDLDPKILKDPFKDASEKQEIINRFLNSKEVDKTNNLLSIIGEIDALKSNFDMTDEEIGEFLIKKSGYFLTNISKEKLQLLIKLRINYNRHMRNIMAKMVKLNYKNFNFNSKEAEVIENDIKKSSFGVKKLFAKIMGNPSKFIKGNGCIDFRSIGGGQIFTNYDDPVLGAMVDNFATLYALSLRYKYIVANHGGHGPEDNWVFSEPINVLGRSVSNQDDALSAILDDIEKVRRKGDKKPIGVFLISCNPNNDELKPQTKNRIERLNVIVRMSQTIESFALKNTKAVFNRQLKSSIAVDNDDLDFIQKDNFKRYENYYKDKDSYHGKIY